MRIQEKRRKGIVLITTMLSVMLVIMLLSTVVLTNFTNLRQTGSFYDREVAGMAAQSGVDYALMRLQNNIGWKGNCAASASVSKKGVHISEDNGNVVGIIDFGRKKGVFRIKFNYEDGAGGLDGLKNSDSPIKSQYVSVNNLCGSIPEVAYSVGSDGKLGKLPTGKAYLVPKYTCSVIVEGFCGAATRNASLKNPIDFNQNYSKRVVESYLSLDSAESYGGGDLVSSGGNFKGVASNFTMKAGPAKADSIRGLKEVNINAKSYKLGDATIYYGKDNGFIKKAKNQGIKVEKSENADSFSRIEWDDIAKATDGPHQTIKAGTYAWCKNKSGKIELRRYNENYPVGKSIPSKDKNYEIIRSAKGFTVDPDNCLVLIDTNTYVQGVNTKNSVNKDFVVRSNINKFGTKPIVGFVNASEGDKNTVILSSDGNIKIYGATLGCGAMTSAGSVIMQGPSVLESDPGVGVSVYSKGDVSITAITNTSTISESNNKNSDKRKASDNPQNKAAAAAAAEKVEINEDTELGEFADSSKAMRAAADFLSDHPLYNYSDTLCENCDHFNDENHNYLYCGRRHVWNAEFKDEIEDLTKKVYAAAALGQTYDAEVRCGFCAGDHGLYEGVRGPYRLVEGGVEVGAPVPECELARHFNEVRAQGARCDLSKYDDEDSLDGSDGDPSLDGDSVDDIENYVDDRLKSHNYKEYKKKQIRDLVARYKSLHYSDQDISGVVYSWGKIKINIGNKSKLHVTGALIAYGGDPAKSDPSDKGTVELVASDILLTSEPNYLNGILKNNLRRHLIKKMYAIY